jgi:hypothetical protein
MEPPRDGRDRFLRVRGAIVGITMSLGTLLVGLTGCGSSSTPVDGADAHQEGGGPSPSADADADADGAGQAVDCPALCDHVATVCEGQANIDALWLDVCRSACMDRVQVLPSSAVAEQACVFAATDCTTAVLCVSSPPSGGG